MGAPVRARCPPLGWRRRRRRPLPVSAAGRGCSAARAGAKSRERGLGARRADSAPGPGLDAAASGAGGRSARHAAVPSAPQLRQREPAPGRSRSPSGRRRRRRRGGATGSTTRSPGSSCGPGGLGSEAARRARHGPGEGHRGAPATLPAGARCRGCAGATATAGRARPAA